ncbi:SRPBCC domain-containing protein [Streptomyces sp. MUM 178J]|uniref:SRPBCC domain-containing protein n=1 Tax=Streptomyces sp. MUM 178J TaxID=2791991 RepID=UPI001F05057E|nr:SRPBCC domain-containing protein [Streptomyces sp. MUM 178J]WRQ82283.1 SRPBCC domain-containing protein [Streptomyces sp. MUM 178J]
MEHEVFVPVPAETLRQVLRDPVRVARCIPGLQQDADETASPLSGRLKVRAGGHTITYRGALRIVEQGDAFAVEGEGVEVRGSGSAKVTLTVRPEPVEEGVTVAVTGVTRAEGRLAELADDAVESAARRLLDRIADRLAAEAAEEAGAAAAQEQPEPEAASAPEGAEPGAEGAVSGPREPENEPENEPEFGHQSGPEHESGPEAAEPGPEEATPTVFDTPVPPPSLDPAAEDESFDESFDGDDGDDIDDHIHIGEPPAAEAAHARRTMIGRSAEEVDHAPPRGRYAPVPAADATSSGGTLRWVAPAAALALASAVVVSRALRRRR